ncbi:MAG: SPASM domain-containing protein [Minisyncoccales bacterium]
MLFFDLFLFLGSFCGLGESIFYLTHEGDITLCTVLNDKEYSAGNIFEDSIKNIWENSLLFDYFRKRKHLKDSECGECKVLSNCGGGCKAKPVMLEGFFNKPDLWACSFYNHNS